MREKQNHIEKFWTQPESRRLEFKEQQKNGGQIFILESCLILGEIGEQDTY